MTVNYQHSASATGQSQVYEAVGGSEMKKRPKRLKSPLESHEQKVFVQWLRVNKIPFYHIPNGGSRNVREARSLKRQGVSRGVPDICIPCPSSTYHGLYIELKRSDGKIGDVSEDQNHWLQYLDFAGYKAEVAFGADHAMQLTREYFGDLTEIMRYNVYK